LTWPHVPGHPARVNPDRTDADEREPRTAYVIVSSAEIDRTIEATI